MEVEEVVVILSIVVWQGGINKNWHLVRLWQRSSPLGRQTVSLLKGRLRKLREGFIIFLSEKKSMD